MKLLERIKSNHLIDCLINLKGNTRACIVCEPLWFIPYSLYAPFATIYMLRLGLDDVQIGLLLSIGMVVQVLASFMGGVITDKLGRRYTTVIFDLLSWSIPCFVWALAQNFWWFLVAAILNSMWQITNNSWTCLLVEDCDKSQIVSVYSLIQICGLLAVFFAPISTLLVESYDTVLVVRFLYVFAGISMTIKFLCLFFKGTETKQGIKRMQETKNVSLTKLMFGYKDVIIKMLKSKQMLVVLFVITSYNVTNMVTTNFFGLYTTESVGIAEGVLPIFPMIRAAIMLFFMFTFQGRLNKLPFKPVMTGGYLLFIAATVILVLTPHKNLGLLFVYTVIEAFSLVLVVPRKDTLAALFIDEQERSRVTGVLYMVMIGVTAPFGWIIGIMSSIDRRLPFMFNVLMFAVSILIIRLSKSVAQLDKDHVEGHK